METNFFRRMNVRFLMDNFPFPVTENQKITVYIIKKEILLLLCKQSEPVLNGLTWAECEYKTGIHSGIRLPMVDDWHSNSDSIKFKKWGVTISAICDGKTQFVLTRKSWMHISTTSQARCNEVTNKLQQNVELYHVSAYFHQDYLCFKFLTLKAFYSNQAGQVKVWSEEGQRLT